MEKDGTEVVADTPQEFAAFIDAEIDRYTRLVRAAGIKAE
jgi:tripartite-type tricarboxylate transporter receptor subunit TctC